MIDFEMEEILG